MKNIFLKRLGITSLLAISFSQLGLSFVLDSQDALVNNVQEIIHDFEWTLSSKFKPELFYGKNISLLNNNEPEDKRIFARHTFDVNADLLYGRKTYDNPVAEFYATARNRGSWGNSESIAPTTRAKTKLLNVVGKEHRHSIPYHVMWLREIWLKLNVGRTMGLSFSNEHTFTIGAFPFELGRGIALGNAYSVGPELLGFYTDYIVDQYAFGARFSGALRDKVLAYDLYAAILNNKSDTISSTGAEIRGQQYGRIGRPERGFGVIDYIIAARLNWVAFDNAKLGSLNLEPYALFNNNPEQQIVFLGDATSKLGTIGFAGEYEGDKFEFGFDYAFNLGGQHVKGWDRNQIVNTNRDGYIVEVNSHVHVNSPGGDNVFFTSSTSDTQMLINSERVLECGSDKKEDRNGQKIGTIQGIGDLYNASNRFRDPYINNYKGYMFVADFGWWILKRNLRLDIAAGISSGDDNPNFDTKDGNYTGFIGLQEIYSGKRVRSVFLLGNASKMGRPLSIPTNNQAPSKFATNISGFTDIIFCGAGLKWDPQNREKKMVVNPNIIAYWEEKPTPKFDAATGKDLKVSASRYLGLEADIFFYYNFLKDLKFFCVSSAFFPGQHYTDIKGKPITPKQKKALERLERTGITQDKIPNLGDDIAYTINVGLEFKF